MGIDLNKASGSTITNNAGVVPEEIHLNVTYKVAQGKGFAAKLAAKAGGKLDLDALLLSFKSTKEVISCAGPGDLMDPFDNKSVFHTGDAKAGGGGAATETIIIRPAQVPSSVHAFVLAVVAYGKTEAFGKLAQMSFSLTDGTSELAQDFLSIENGVQAKLLFKLVRNGDSWDISPLTTQSQSGIAHASDWRGVANEARNLV